MYTVVAMLVSEDGATVSKDRLEAIIAASDGRPPLTDLSELYTDSDASGCTTDMFESWIMKHADLASFSEWLLGEGTSEDDSCGFRLEAEPDPPTFYQTLAKMYQCKLM